MERQMKCSMAAIAACVFSSVAGYAATIVSVQSVTATAGGSGAFDVFLTNSGPSSILVGAFTFGISTMNSAISFTGANTSTVLNSYIFAGNSLFGPDLTGPNHGQSLSVSDVFATPLSGIVVTSGTTVGLGHVLFSVAANSAAGAFPISLGANPATSLSDPFANDITINTLSDGTLIISGVPEPSSLFLLLTGIPLVWVRNRLLRVY